MSTLEEKRQYARANVKWPVFLLTPQYILEAEAKNISLGGAFIHCLTDPLHDESFRIVIKPPTHRGFLVATAKVAWTSHQMHADDDLSGGVGLRFTGISPDDRQFLSNLT